MKSAYRPATLVGMSRLKEYAVLAGRTIKRMPMPTWVYTSGFGKARVAQPGGAVLKKHAVDVSIVARTRVVWLDRHKAANGIILHIHGGSYVSGPFSWDWQWMSDQADRRECAAVLVDYRHAPDYPHPTALVDCEEVVAQLARDEVLRESNWILSGQQAGGGIALALAERLGHGADDKDVAVPAPSGLVLMSPWWDLELHNVDITATEQRDPVHERRILELAAKAYAGRTPLDDPALSPVNANLEALPPIHLSVGMKDIFLTDTRIMKLQFERQGLDVDYRECAGKLVGMGRLPRGADAKRLFDEQAAFIRSRLGEPTRLS